MNWLPKCYVIEIEENYFDGIYDECTTGTSKYYWTGKKLYKWLWFEFGKNFKYGVDFKVENGKLNFTKAPAKNTSICVTSFRK
jgi:hypothetical protein